MAQQLGHRHGARLRAPRVQIAYELHVGGEERRKELPFVVGVLADIAGTPNPPLPKVRERTFETITRGNLNAVMQGIAPRLALTVPNRLSEAGGGLAVTLRFERLEDFEPESVARQVPPIQRLIALRAQLSALRALARRDPSVAVRLQSLAGAAPPDAASPPTAEQPR